MAEQQLSANPNKNRGSGSASPGSPGRSTARKGSAPASPGTTPRGTGAKSPKKTAAKGSPGTRSPRRVSPSATPSRMASLIALRQPGNASPVRSRGIPSPGTAAKRLFGYMTDAMNPDAQPCVDFYENVCGRWRAGSSHRVPYREEHVRAFNRRVADALLSRAARIENSTEQLGLEDQMALFYSSCFSMAAGYRKASNVTAVLAAIATDSSRWTQASTFGALLDLAVSTALRSGLPSFLRIQLFRRRPYRVSVGETLASTFSQRLQEAKQFVSSVIHDLGAELSSSTNSTALFLIDRRVESGRAKADDQPWTALRSPDELKFIAPELLWRDALQRGLPSILRTERENETGVEVRGADSIRSIIGYLRQQQLRAAGLYALVVLLAQPTLSPRFPATDEAGNESLRAMPLLATLGPEFLPNLAAVTAAGVGEEEPAPKEYWLPQLRGHVGYSGDGQFLISSTYVSGTGVFADVSADRSLQTSANIGLIQRAVLFSIRRYVYTGMTKETSRRLQDYAPYFATRYATIGTLILRSIFDSDATYFPSWAHRYIDGCFASSASRALGQLVDRRLARAIMRSRWSALLAKFLKARFLGEAPIPVPEAAEQATAERSAVNRASANNDKLFFRLLCFVECGEPDGRQLCNDMAALDRQFTEAFKCPWSDVERGGSCDCYGMNHCETHLPTATGAQKKAV
ncbi:hypothetical protein V5799_020889 [Amblyomma americanum]|uniref:Uncharacterized protein n=1 Tax=Amblyomma americanum TaxID=6943 RepID=A0AAQ4ESM8_AMBAM